MLLKCPLRTAKGYMWKEWLFVDNKQLHICNYMLPSHIIYDGYYQYIEVDKWISIQRTVVVKELDATEEKVSELLNMNAHSS